MTAELAQSIREVLRDGASPVIKLSKRADALLNELRDEMPTAGDPSPVEELDTGRFRMWTYAGSKRNRSLLAGLRSSGAIRAEGLFVDFAVRPTGLRPQDWPGRPNKNSPLVKEHLESIKFGDLMSVDHKMVQTVHRSFS